MLVNSHKRRIIHSRLTIFAIPSTYLPSCAWNASFKFYICIVVLELFYTKQYCLFLRKPRTHVKSFYLCNKDIKRFLCFGQFMIKLQKNEMMRKSQKYILARSPKIFAKLGKCTFLQVSFPNFPAFFPI